MNKLTNEQKTQFKSLYWQDNKTLSEIALMFGVSCPAIRMWFVKLGIPRRTNSQAQLLSNKTDEITPDLLRHLYLTEQLSQDEIATKLGRTQSGIGLLLRSHGVQMRGKSNPGPRNGMYGRTHTPEAREKMREANRRQFSTQTARDKHAVLTARQITEGNTGKTHNKPETAFASILDNLNIEHIWQYRLGRFAYDFFLPQQNTIIEIHGTFWHADPRFYFRGNLSQVQQHNAINDKRKASFARRNGFSFLFFWEHDVYNNPDKIKTRLDML